MTDTVIVNSDNVIEVSNLRDITGAYQNAATVTVETIYDSDGAQLVGPTYPIAMSYVAASNGTYRCTIEETVTLLDGERYTAIVKAVSSTLVREFRKTFIARMASAG